MNIYNLMVAELPLRNQALPFENNLSLADDKSCVNSP